MDKLTEESILSDTNTSEDQNEFFKTQQTKLKSKNKIRGKMCFSQFFIMESEEETSV